MRASDIEHLKGKPWFMFSRHTEDLPDRLYHLVKDKLIVFSTSENGTPPGDIPYIAAGNITLPSQLKHVQPCIDFDQVKSWLGICTEIHADLCHGIDNTDQPLEQWQSTASISRYQQGDNYNIHNLRVMDCHNGDVVLATGNDPYVALSYVWGNDSGATHQTSPYPKTIRDAMAVTLKLGYRWLWVDKYCINKSTPEDFYKQLQQMDVIYKSAAVTIVAAAGDGTQYGLPGVDNTQHGSSGADTRYRKQQLFTSINDEYMHTMPKLDFSPQTCRWMTRAWTYQEGLLSTRRLIFTDDQLYFECRGSYLVEMLHLHPQRLKKLEAPGKRYYHHRYRNSGRMGLFPLNGCGVDPWDLYNRISEYSERSLTHDSDILNGILGIFRAFEKLIVPMRHIWGIPFPKETSVINEAKRFHQKTKRVWPMFSESLQWGLERPSRRRLNFPSWSWTGWYGKVTWPAQYTDVGVYQSSNKLGRPRNPKLNEEAFQLSVELRNGAAISWAEFQANYDTLLGSNELSQFIRMEAQTTPTSCVFDATGDQVCGIQFLLQLVDGSPLAVSADITAAYDLRPHDTFLALHVLRTMVGNQGRDIGMVLPPIVTQHLVIVKDMGGHWERVATAFYVVDREREVNLTWQCVRLG
ncbi:hypothetical protein GRF29_69g143538 [Pseudopithomyces chartarum]|uniref:Heterokaryon incompatibility domain-containing protein n=1 Tax=Pseudopithomyces chartarum TaxID=1892770 RepID=A0AAN6M0U8_9PLEO|nr:hypothetical protein GRF29_69g143538 [Pseudopithomyces chartarum]